VSARGWLVATALAAAALGLAGCGGGRQYDPAATVRGFLTATADGNGEQACGYLTEAARAELQDAGGGQGCGAVFDGAVMRIGDRNITTEQAIQQLRYREEEDGDAAVVQVAAGGAERTFHLRRADLAERSEFQPPAGDWRIESDVAFLFAP
jgi:hypothetical protein